MKTIFKKSLAPFMTICYSDEELFYLKENIINENVNIKIIEARNAIARMEFDRISKMILPNDNKYIELSDIDFNLKQKMLINLLSGGRILNSIALANSNKSKIWFPLPKSWEAEFKKVGFKFNEPISRLMWEFLVIAIVLKSVFSGIKKLLKILKKSNPSKLPSDFEDRYSIYLPTATELQINSLEGNDKKFCFVNWLSKNSFQGQKIHVFHTVADSFVLNDSNLCVSQSILNIRSNEERIRNRFKVLLVINIQLINLILCNLKNILILLMNFASIVEFFEVKSILLKTRIDQVIFFNSSDIVKPLWSNAFERKGTPVIQCFYSISVDPQSEELGLLSGGQYAISTWQEMWVVDEYQREFLKKIIKYSGVNFRIVGVPFWSDSDINFIAPTRNCICVFDFTLPKNTLDPSIIVFENLYRIENLRKYFVSILNIAKDLNCVVLHKRKHRFQSRDSEEYANMITELKNLFPDTYISVDSRIAPERIISESFASISMPVSTTGVISKNYNVSSAYFDPSLNFVKVNNGLRGVKLINTETDLRDWLQSKLLGHH